MCPANEELNEEMLIDRFHMIEKHREQASIRVQNHQQAASRYYDSKVRDIAFVLRDLILRKVFEDIKERGDENLGTEMEGTLQNN